MLRCRSSVAVGPVDGLPHPALDGAARCARAAVLAGAAAEVVASASENVLGEGCEQLSRSSAALSVDFAAATTVFV